MNHTHITSAALSEALHGEISSLGLRSIVFELGYFRSSFLTDSNRGGYYSSRIADYKEMTDVMYLLTKCNSRSDLVFLRTDQR